MKLKLHKYGDMGFDLTPFDNLPTFLVSQQVLQLINDQAEVLMETTMAMHEAGIYKLPFPEMVISLDINEINAHAVLREEEGTNSFSGHFLLSKNNIPVEFDTEITSKEQGINNIKLSIDRQRFPNFATKDVTNSLVDIVSFIMNITVVMMSISLIDREEVIPPPKLNAARVKRGKEPIRPYTYMNITRLLKSQQGNNSTVTGRVMPIHMRAGYVRRQNYGPNNSLSKLIYIEPVIVNFHTGEELKAPIRKLV